MLDCDHDNKYIGDVKIDGVLWKFYRCSECKTVKRELV